MNEIECYAIKHKDGYFVSVGLTVIDTWRIAEQCLGDPPSKLKKLGYSLVVGNFNEKNRRK